MDTVQIGNLTLCIKSIIGPRRKTRIVVAELVGSRQRFLFESMSDAKEYGLYTADILRVIDSGEDHNGLTFRTPTTAEIGEYLKAVTGDPFRRIAPPGFKVCGNTKCREIRPVSDFNKGSQADGLKNYCRSCQNRDGKRYASENVEKIRRKHRENYYANIDARREKAREYSAKHAAERGEASRRWYYSNRERRLRVGREWYAANPDKRRALGRAKARRRRARLALVDEHFTAEMEMVVLRCFDSKCFNCGSTKKLCIDHHRALYDGHALELGNAVLLCISCNSSKGKKAPERFYAADVLIRLEEVLKISAVGATNGTIRLL